MLDIILLTSSVGFMKFISQQHHFTSRPLTLTSPAALARVGSVHGTPSGHFQIDCHSGLSHKAPRGPLLHLTSRAIFQTTLLLSLWLFSLSILEAAPSSWLLVIIEPSQFVRWYRIILWALCVLLEVVIPTFLGVFLTAKFLFDDVGSSGIDHTSSNSSLSSPPSQSLKPPTNQTGERTNQHRVLILLHGLCIIIRFLFFVSWFIIKRITSIFLSFSQCKKNRNRTSSNIGEKLARCIDFCQRLKPYCSAKAFLPALFGFILSFLMLRTLSTLVINSNVNDFFDGSHLVSDNKEYQRSSSSRFCWTFGPHSPLKLMVKMSCALGMIIASALNGFGCASMPHANLVGIYLKPTSSAVLAKVEEDHFYAVKVLEEKTFILSSLSWLSLNETAENNKVRQLRDEINFMENLVGDMSDDIEEMKHSQELALKARTPVGRISWILGMVFSVILVIRVALAASTVWGAKQISNTPSMHRQRGDPITIILLWLTGHHVVSDEQYDLYLQATSLMLAAFLTLSQVRAFFRCIGALYRKLSLLFSISIDQNQKSIGDVSLLLSTFVMGCYFLSCVVVMKMSLPIECRSSFSAAIGKLDFGFNSTVLNMVFFTSACTSATILGFLFGIKRNNSERYSVESTFGPICSFSKDAAIYAA